MSRFVQENYPEYWDIYRQFPYHIQRWDAIRYLILYKTGGMYVDFDYESLKNMDELITGKSCCFALEPEYQYTFFRKKIMFNNALMFCTPGHPFMKIIIEAVFSEKMLKYPTSPKDTCVMNTTGPWVLIDLYEKLSVQEKNNVYLIPAKYVTPLDGYQARLYREGENNLTIQNHLQEAYAVHYFFGEWRNKEYKHR